MALKIRLRQRYQTFLIADWTFSFSRALIYMTAVRAAGHLGRSPRAPFTWLDPVVASLWTGLRRRGPPGNPVRLR